MAFLFDSFEGWKRYSEEKKQSLITVVLEYEIEQKGQTEVIIWERLNTATDPRAGTARWIRHRKPCEASSGVGTLKLETLQPCGLKTFITFRMTPSLPEVSMPWSTTSNERLASPYSWYWSVSIRLRHCAVRSAASSRSVQPFVDRGFQTAKRTVRPRTLKWSMPRLKLPPFARYPCSRREQAHCVPWRAVVGTWVAWLFFRIALRGSILLASPWHKSGVKGRRAHGSESPHARRNS